MREIDRRAIEEYHIPGIVLMENAARGVADVAMEMLSVIDRRQTVTIICGSGNNGGDGFAVARHLHNHGVDVLIGQAWSDEPKGDAATNLAIARAMKVRILPWESVPSVMDGFGDLVIDALFGTGLSRAIGEPLDFLVSGMETRSKLPILAIDVPSGLDCDTGEPLGACVKAARTVTFVAEKAGFANPRSKEFTGEIIVADIGCPRELIDEVARMNPT